MGETAVKGYVVDKKEDSKLVWIIGQLLDLPKCERRKLARGLWLVWNPGRPGGMAELIACRPGVNPSPKEDGILLAAIKTAAKKRGKTAVVQMEPSIQTEGWGATRFMVRLVEQVSLFERKGE